MEKNSKPNPPHQSGFQRLWQALKRRHVVRVATVYAIVGWLVIQVANVTFADFGIPVWAYRSAVPGLIVGVLIEVFLSNIESSELELFILYGKSFSH